jgi:exopolysaccharide biosynthesis protein
LRTYQGEGTFSELVEAAQDQEESEIIVAINGDYWNYMNYERSTVRNGELINKRDYPGRRDYCAIWSSGNMRTYPYTIDPELLEGAWQTFSFGPRLMNDGRAIDDYSDIFDYDLAWHSHPRTAIGYYEPNHYCFLTVFGRTNVDNGCYLEQMAKFFEELGCRDAYNLDGGSSCHIWYEGEEIGKPDEDKPLSDIIYVRKAKC